MAKHSVVRRWVFTSAWLLAFGVSGAAAGDVDSVVVVVSADNPVSELTRHQVVDMFLGQTVQWPDGRPVEPLDQAPQSDARGAFNSGILERSAAQVRAHWAKLIFTGRGRPPVHLADGEAVKAALSANPNAIGYLLPHEVDATVAVVRLR